MSQPTLYLVLCGKHIDEYAPERDVKDMTWDGTVKDVAAGQFENLTRVIEIGTDQDVTDKLAREVSTIWARSGESLSYSQYSFVEQAIGTRAARSFVRAA